MVVEWIDVENSKARLQLIPALGGGIGRLDVRHPSAEWIPVLRPWNGRVEDGPFELGCNVLVPFSNRISRGGFEHGGAFHPIPPNLAGQPLPIHGDGFQRCWRLLARNGETVELECDGAIGPFRYRARQVFTLWPEKLDIKLTVHNMSGQPLPFGIGFHPWFPRNVGTRLQFSAAEVWLEDREHLPTGRRKLCEVPDWNFGDGRALPDQWINNAFGGWAGEAVIMQGDGAASVRISASDNLGYALLYTPNADADFFCFEPVSHPVDAHNLAGRPGLRILEDGQELTGSMTLEWEEAYGTR
ncbi:aldose 1-epimerase [Ensifer adhaerens]|uniref:aldose 1-epimerase n=1 Tax=Ensifer adhaerens TaxID=106592 RepID=UPI001C4DDC01|nr:aldose 1-epimerase [Ensifer adhaerens]MBW0371229.1 aldose 1-epimerase [Ensifer adhaerens]UCM24331.1 aldose 1-epimerase [Ensifer adhaerens]